MTGHPVPTSTELDDAAFAAVASLVRAGEYLDAVPGRTTKGTDGPGAYRGDRRTGFQRLYDRGSAELDGARAAGLVDPMPALTPATAAQVEAVESQGGRPLPPLARRLYLELGNGGFGPGYGLLPLDEPSAAYAGASVIGQWQGLRSGGMLDDRPAMLPLCDWGCGILSLVELAPDPGRMWGFDPNPAPEDLVPLFLQELTFADWLLRWAELRLYQPCLVEDEDGLWRGATQSEIEGWMADL